MTSSNDNSKEAEATIARLQQRHQNASIFTFMTSPRRWYNKGADLHEAIINKVAMTSSQLLFNFLNF